MLWGSAEGVGRIHYFTSERWGGGLEGLCIVRNGPGGRITQAFSVTLFAEDEPLFHNTVCVCRADWLTSARLKT